MMRAGKDYITKSETAEDESPRALYLRELLKAVAPQTEEEAKTEAQPVKPVNQSKPTLKLAK